MHLYLILFIALSVLTSPVLAIVTPITNKTQWQNAVGTYNAVTFTDLPAFTIVTNQYADLGIHFTDGDDFVFVSGSFPIDGHGLVSSEPFGEQGRIGMSFSEPQYGLAFEYTGFLWIELYSQGELIFLSQQYVDEFQPFVGVVSTTPFDAAIAWDFAGSVKTIENVYFGPNIPGPGALAAFGLVAAGITRRRRR